MSLADLASLATAIGVVLVALQLVLARLQTRTSLEDELSREYREIAARLPLAAFFDNPDPDHQVPPLSESLGEFVRYFDLSNQQVFLRQERRVSRKTWVLWADGIQDNLTRDAFAAAWTYVRAHSPKSYNELASFRGDWDCDPASWLPAWWELSARRRRRQVSPAPLDRNDVSRQRADRIASADGPPNANGYLDVNAPPPEVAGEPRAGDPGRGAWEERSDGTS